MNGLNPEFIIERQGKQYVLYAGLLDLAHRRGLRSITTTLVQTPTELNGQVAIATATVELATAATGEVLSFSGIGDASPGNVNRMVANATIRMAETRAKARALRDAVNVGVTALEEEAPEDEAPASAPGAPPSPARWTEPKRLRALFDARRHEGARLGVDPDLLRPLTDDADEEAIMAAGLRLKQAIQVKREELAGFRDAPQDGPAG